MAMGQRMTKKNFYLIIITLFLVSCSTSQCYRKDKVPAMPNNSNVDKNLKINKGIDKPKTVFVFKYDGSLQCGQGQAIPIAEMAKQLDGIKIYSQVNRGDGLMHIQVCGSTTGQANVYEIAETDLDKAIKKGFKPWASK